MSVIRSDAPVRRPQVRQASASLDHLRGAARWRTWFVKSLPCGYHVRMGLMDADEPRTERPRSGGLPAVVGLSLALAALALGVAIVGYLRVQPATSDCLQEPTVRVPIGAVVPFAAPAPTLPADWLVCDGRAISRSDYAALFAVVGTVHGEGDGSATFNLPDYRGRFLRGVDGGVGRDPDRDQRQEAQPGGAVGDAVGSVQDDALAAHAHEYERYRLKDVDWQRGVKHHRNGTGDLADTGETAAAGASETRPKNANVLWVIRAR